MQCNPPSLIELQSLEVQLTTTLQYSLLERTMGMLFRLLKVIRVFFLNNSIYLLNPYNTLNVVQAHYKNKSEQNEVLFSALRDKWGYLIFFRKKICFIIIKGVFFFTISYWIWYFSYYHLRSLITGLPVLSLCLHMHIITFLKYMDLRLNTLVSIVQFFQLGILFV